MHTFFSHYEQNCKQTEWIIIKLKITRGLYYLVLNFSYHWYRFALYSSSPSVIFLPLHGEMINSVYLICCLLLPKWYTVCRIFVMLLCSTQIPVISLQVCQSTTVTFSLIQKLIFWFKCCGLDEHHLKYPTLHIFSVQL